MSSSADCDIWMLGADGGSGPRPVVKLVGAGGAGLNILSAIPGFRKAAISTSEERLRGSKADERLLFDRREVEALATTDSSVADIIGTEGADAVRGVFEGVDVAFIFGGLGGTMFGPMAPFLCRSARKSGALAIAIAVMPFSAEGQSRARRASFQMGRLVGSPHGLVQLSNDTLAQISPNLPLAKSFNVMDHVVGGLIADLSSCIVRPDLPRIKGFLERAGPVRLTGGASTVRRFPEGIVNEACEGPWLSGPGGVKSVLMVLRGEAPSPADALELAKGLGERLGPFDLAYALRAVPTKGRLSATLLMGSGIG